MTTYLRIIHAGRLLDTLRAPAPDRVGNDHYYNLSLEELIHMTPDLETHFRIIDAGRILYTVRAPAPEILRNHRYYNIYIEELIHMAPDPQTRRRLGGLLKRLLDRATDPDREHPVLDILRERVFPILMQYFLSQIPIWLATIADDDDEPTVA